MTFARFGSVREKTDILEKIAAIKGKTKEIAFRVSEIKLKQSVLEHAGAKYIDLSTHQLSRVNFA